MSKNMTIPYERKEVNWMYGRIRTVKETYERIIQEWSGSAILTKAISEDQQKALEEAQANIESITKLCHSVGDILTAGDESRLKIHDLRTSLNEAFDLVEEDSAKQEIMNRLKQLPKEEPYRITVDRATAKFLLKLVENDLHKFRSHIIPNYEASKPEDHKDPIQTKSFWVNKSKASKVILENLKGKLSKALS
jgi:hypothetical protein